MQEQAKAVTAVEESVGTLDYRRRGRRTPVWPARRPRSLGQAVVALAVATVMLLCVFIVVLVLIGAARDDFGRISSDAKFVIFIVGSVFGGVMLLAGLVVLTVGMFWLAGTSVPPSTTLDASQQR